MSADHLVFEESLTPDPTGTPFSDKDFVYALDQNQGSYSGQILLDTTTLSNSDRFANYREAYIEIPVVLSLSNSTTTAGNAATANSFNGQSCPFGMALKNGFYQLVHSISVDINGKTLVSQQPYVNMYTQFKLMSTFSQEDLAKFGASIGFAPDTSTSYQYSAAASADGINTCNNRNNPSWQSTAGGASTGTTASTGQAFNGGLLARQQNLAMDLSADTLWRTYMTSANAASVGKAYYANMSAAAYKVWFLVAKVRLKDVCPLFNSMPLVKGAAIKVTLYTNTGSATVTNVAAGPTMTTTAANVSILGGTLPFMVASSTANNGLNGLVTQAGNGNVIANVSIARVTNSSLASYNAAHPTLTACRLYVPLYQFTPEMAGQYLSLGTTKKVKYTDIQSFQVLNTAAGGTFNALISNGIPNPQRVILIPFHSYSAVLSPLLSPFDSAPGTSTPLISLTQLNVQVGGQNTWTMNELYDYEQFLHELVQTGVNGGQTTGLASGLISQLDFEHSYRYYVCNVGRRLPAQDGVPQSIQIQGTNNSALAIDLYVFVEYERSFTLDVASGEIKS